MSIDECLSTEINENGKNMRYFYRLTEKSFLGDKVYGIEIERQDYKNDKIIGLERDSVEIVSKDKNKVNKIINMLFNNNVSPIHLVDIVGEYVDQYVSEFN